MNTIDLLDKIVSVIKNITETNGENQSFVLLKWTKCLNEKTDTDESESAYSSNLLFDEIKSAFYNDIPVIGVFEFIHKVDENIIQHNFYTCSVSFIDNGNGNLQVYMSECDKWYRNDNTFCDTF